MAARRMIIVDDDQRRFSCRVAGVAVEDGHVLLHRATHENFWTFPGGHAELGEDSATTLRREMREELGLDVEIARLSFLVENFFSYGGKQRHELLLLYEVRLPAGFSRSRGQTVHRTTEDAGYELEFQWLPIDEASLAAAGLVPEFLRRRLAALPPQTEHVVWSEKSI